MVRPVTNPLGIAVLTLLLERPMHPYEMAQTLRERNKEGSFKINYGSLYTVVDRLAAQQLIEGRETERDGRRPERTVYGITDAGRAEAEDRLAEWLSVPVKEFTRFEAALSVAAALPPEQVVELLRRRATRLDVAVGQEQASCATARASGLPRLFWVEDELRIALLGTERDFVLDLATDIETGGMDGIQLWRHIHAAGLLDGSGAMPTGAQLIEQLTATKGAERRRET